MSRTRTIMPGLKAGSAMARLIVEPVLDLLRRQHALLDQQPLEGEEPALIVVVAFIDIRRQALDGPAHLVDIEDAVAHQEHHQRVDAPLRQTRVMLIALEGSGRQAAQIMHRSHAENSILLAAARESLLG